MSSKNFFWCVKFRASFAWLGLAAIALSTNAQEKPSLLPIGGAPVTGSLSNAPAPVVSELKLTDVSKITGDLATGTANVIVLLTPPQELARTDFASKASLENLRPAIKQLQQDVLVQLSTNDVKTRFRFDNIAGFSAEVSAQGLKALQADPRVISIEPVHILQPNLAQGIPLMRGMTYRSTYNGAGMAIAICDTGIDYNHPRLGGGGFPNSKVIGGFDFGDLDANPIPNGDQAHGTACAGIAAGDLGTVGDYIGGVAYNAKLYALKISYGSGGSAGTDAMVAAWDWCVTHQNDNPSYPIMVISTSFGGGQHFSTCDSTIPSMTTAANNAVAAGITVLAASGNDGYCDSMGWPACISSVISVGAVYDAALGHRYHCVDAASCAPKLVDCSIGFYTDDLAAPDKVISYANVATFLTLLAPSEDCYTTDISGPAGYSGGDYVSGFNGTSAACPYAAGAVACLQSAAKALTGNFLTPQTVRTILTANGDNITDTKVSITKPRVNLERAIQSLGVNPVPGAVVAWGDNQFGQTNVPVAAQSGVMAIAAGGFHTVALKSNGTVLAWGENADGQRTVPVAAQSGVMAIAAGYIHTVALKSNGTVVAWGNNDYGQRTVPVGLSAVMAIAAGYSHTVALKSNGTVVAWGDNTYGQTNVPIGLSSVMAITAGGLHTVALKSDGTVVAWGRSSEGQTTVPAGLSGVMAIAAGMYHSVALKSNGTLVAWGNNDYGQRTVPAAAQGGVIAIAAGFYHTAALKNNGSVVAWGNNDYGQTDVPTGLSEVTAIAGGREHTVARIGKHAATVTLGSLSQTYNGSPCGATATTSPAGLTVNFTYNGSPNAPTNVESYTVVGTINNLYYQGSATNTLVVGKATATVILGSLNQVYDGTAKSVTATTSPAGLAVNLTYNGSLNTPTNVGIYTVIGTINNPNYQGSATNTFAIIGPTPAFTVVGWGNNGSGQTNVPIGLNKVVAIAAGSYHCLALTADDRVVGWGGQTNIPSGLSNVVAIAAGGDHSLALTAAGRVVAWGYNGFGLANIPSSLSNATAIAAGGNHNLGLTTDGRVIGWGNNTSGQTNIPSGLSNVVAIAGGGNHSLALTSEGRVVGWGRNLEGQTNIPNGLSNVVAIAGGGYHSLALTAEGRVVGWGQYWNGATYVPVAIPDGLSNVVAIAGGGHHGLAITAERRVVGWGYNGFGQTDIPNNLSNVVAIAAGWFHSLALIGKTTSAVTLGNLSQMYDGTSKSVSATTAPAGLAVNLTYNGSPNAPINVGSYTVIGTINDQYYQGSATGTLVINPPAPIITTQPQSQTVAVGANAGFNVVAGSIPPFAYQWGFDGTDLPGRTNFLLNLTNVQLANAGYYQVRVTNVSGSALSLVANLSVVAPLTNSAGFVSGPGGLADWWPAEANANDMAGPNNGIPKNAVWYPPGKVGLAFSFDGSTSAIYVEASDIPPPWTACFWVNRQNATDPSAALMSSSGYALKLEQYNLTRKVGITQYGVADYTFNYTAPFATWVHLVFVGAGSNTLLYANGVFQDSLPVNIFLPRTYIGAAFSQTKGAFFDHLQGSLDEISLFNRALSASEIQAIFSAGNAGLFVGPTYALNIIQQGGNVQLSWPVAYGNCNLLSSATLTGAWITNTSPRTISGGNISVTLPANNNRMFYRLKSGQ